MKVSELLDVLASDVEFIITTNIFCAKTRVLQLLC